MLVRIFCLLLIGSVCSGDCISIQTQKGTIEAAGFDVLGAPIQMVNADLLEAKTMRKLASAKKGRFDGVLYGEYTVRLAAPGFYAVDVAVRLDQATLNVRAQLAPGEECRTFSTIAGRATGAKVAAGLWAELPPGEATSLPYPSIGPRNRQTGRSDRQPGQRRHRPRQV